MLNREGLVIASWVVCTLVVGCEKRELRGRIEKSKDRQTYLSIDDDNGGGCPIFVDGSRWSKKPGSAASIAPGSHVITFKCGKTDRGADYQISITRGTTFHFDYWGP